MKKSLTILFLAASPLLAQADVVDDAAYAIEVGNYEDARNLLLQELHANPKTAKGGVINTLLGDIAAAEGDFELAESYYAVGRNKGVADAWLGTGQLAYLDYDFDKAETSYAKYRELKRKAKKEVEPKFTLAEKQLERAQDFMERIEKLVVIDSISVPKQDFFKRYRLPASAGRLVSADDKAVRAVAPNDEIISPVYVSESGDMMLWSQIGGDGEVDEDGDPLDNYLLQEAIRQSDGELRLHDTGDFASLAEPDEEIAYPFMMSDGCTLYFAKKGEESIGGYDIFVATRDTSTGEFMQPQNIGMPYNSPYDDYLLAFDEENGVGWWATDRNRLGDMVTIYLFRTNDMRVNYNPEEDDDLENKARIADYRSTQTDDTDYDTLSREINSIVPVAKKRVDFQFPVGKGIVYTNLDDFKTREGKAAMKQYLEASKVLDSQEEQLSQMRQKYSRGSAAERSALADKILAAEKDLEKQRTEVANLRNTVYKAEKK